MLYTRAAFAICNSHSNKNISNFDFFPFIYQYEPALKRAVEIIFSVRYFMVARDNFNAGFP